MIAGKTKAAAGPTINLWHRYAKARSPKLRTQLRNRLVEAHIALVDAVLAPVLFGVPAWVDIAAVRQAAMIGLIQAVENFDITRPVKFATYASRRIRGAAIDCLRELEPRTRRIADDQRKREAAESELANQIGQRPSTEEVKNHLGWSEETMARSRIQSPLSLEWTSGESEGHDNDFVMAQTLDDSRDPVDGDQFDNLDYATRGLDLQARFILWLYLYRGFTMTKIAPIVGMSESRVSQIFARGIKFLKEARTRQELVDVLTSDRQQQDRQLASSLATKQNRPKR